MSLFKTITLLTDFGMKDPYAGIMKGVILSINPGVTIIDITHEIEPQDIREGAFLLNEYYPYFPRGTIHLAVVDPTVGSERRPIIVRHDGHLFVGPDNGIFSLLIGDDTAIYAVENPRYMLPRVSPTFHGRDVFAPVAAHLSAGLEPSVFGGSVKNPVILPGLFPDIKDDTLLGEIVRFDRFGNGITNIDVGVLERFTGSRPYAIQIKGMSFKDLNKSYYEKDLTCLAGSGGYLEFGCYKVNFAKEKDVRKGDKVMVTLVKREHARDRRR